MNPVSIDLSMRNPVSAGTRFYVASLHLDGRQVVARSFSASTGSNVSATLNGINIQRPGVYHFRIENTNRRGVSMPGIKYKVRRNSKVADMRIV